jgi:uncharacterized integral membrane protein
MTDPATPGPAADPETGRTTGPESRPTSGPKPGHDPLDRTRTSGAWTAVVVAGLFLVLLVIFIAQNTDPVHVAFLGWDGEPPLAVTILIAAALGVIITGAVGTLRILQLRRRVRRERR